jgi:elongation of very long chain fatty acids protein 4
MAAAVLSNYQDVWPLVWASRFIKSYQHEQGLWEKRVSAGHQPDLPLTSVQFIAGVSSCYLAVTFLLHRYMKQRASPFQCRPFKQILLTYNFICVLLAGYVVWGIGYVLLTVPERKFVCNALVHADSDGEKFHASFLAKVFFVFYAQKFWEFLDTWFFLLRKSFRQVTFLHVFHHCSICVVVGLIIPFEFNGDMYLPIFLNALVHVLMYSHYLVSALGLSTPWKPYLTSMQLFQFMLIAIQSGMSLSRGDSCGAPYFAKVLMVVYMGSMLLLFGNFFLNAYVLKKPSAQFGGGVVKKMEPLQVTRSHSGRVILDGNGTARVELPSQFSGGELAYQVTPIGRPMPNLHISDEKQSDQACTFTLSGGVPNKAVSWTVTMVLTILGEKPKPAPSCCAPHDAAQDPSCCKSPHDDVTGGGRSSTPRGGGKKLR